MPSFLNVALYRALSASNLWLLHSSVDTVPTLPGTSVAEPSWGSLAGVNEAVFPVHKSSVSPLRRWRDMTKT